eukprot:TRINITY_DN8116_c0_g1_i1.p1 TRINITY_DN8116_c0_g1~~TRINITY_DN8116_c0_g1_i1.p1  ORF type:complete len:341 (+),score=36.22 TRINITY_DN8116_c0_g1_i1:89-1111(+)
MRAMMMPADTREAGGEEKDDVEASEKDEGSTSSDCAGPAPWLRCTRSRAVAAAAAAAAVTVALVLLFIYLVRMGQTPFSALGCATVRQGDENWIWAPGTGKMWSCNLPVRGDIASMCVTPDGTPDYTSIYVNMDATNRKSGCFVWKATDCSLDLRKVRNISFDADVTDCDNLWTAPLWMSPTPWRNPAQFSGEVDFLEMCPVNSIFGNFATGGKQLRIASATGLGGPKTIVMTLGHPQDLHANGTLRTEVCDLGAQNCHQGSYYTKYLSTVTATKWKEHSFPFTLISDVWNGYGGDAGWAGCRAENNPSSDCKYVIRNIRVYAVDGKPYFQGRCAALNGD